MTRWRASTWRRANNWPTSPMCPVLARRIRVAASKTRSRRSSSRGSAASSKSLPKYIQDWHDYVEARPERRLEGINNVKQIVADLLARDDVFYDPADVETCIQFCSMLRHKEGRRAGQPLELSIEKKDVAACVLGIKRHDPELDMDVRYF